MVAGFYLHMGWPSPPALHFNRSVGFIVGDDLFPDAVDAKLGRHDQRTVDAAWCVAQSRIRSGTEIFRSWYHVLRHGNFRRPVAFNQNRQRTFALHRLDNRSRSRRSTWLERIHDVRHALLDAAKNLPDKTLEYQARNVALLGRHIGHLALHRTDLRCRFDSRPDVACVHTRRQPCLSRFR